MADQWSLATIPELDDRQFIQWRELLERRVGMQLTEQRRSLLRTSLNIRMREIGCSDYQEYFELVVNGGKGLHEWSILVDRLTVQETRFFRDPASIDLVSKYIADHQSSKDQLNIWSVGCATGEEPYSLAIAASHILEDPSQYSITASDISQHALTTAREGFYSGRKIEAIPERYRKSSLSRNGDTYQMLKPIRDRICFVKQNVLDLDRFPFSDFDIIYCQNLLIYFRRWRRKEIISQMAKRLSAGGMIVLGSGEVTDWFPDGLIRVQNEHTLAFLKPLTSRAK